MKNLTTRELLIPFLVLSSCGNNFNESDSDLAGYRRSRNGEFIGVSLDFEKEGVSMLRVESPFFGDHQGKKDFHFYIKRLNGKIDSVVIDAKIVAGQKI